MRKRGAVVFESSASASSAGQRFKIARPRLSLKKSTGHPQPPAGRARTQGLAYRPHSTGVSPPGDDRAVFPRFCMATVTPLSEGTRPEHRGLSFWMDRVVAELENVRSSPDADAVLDLRVAIRRCRSLASVMEEVDPDPAWQEMRKTVRKLFH